MAERLSRREIAERWGVSKQAVDKVFKDGRLKAGDDGKADLVDVDRVRAEMNQANIAREAETKAIGGQQKGENGGQHPIMRVRLAKEAIDVKHRELKLKKLQGEVVERSEVKMLLFEAGRAIQNALKAWPARLSGEIAAHRGLPEREFQQRVRTILERDTKRILSDMTVALESIGTKNEAA